MTPAASNRVSWEVVTKTSCVAGSGSTSPMASVMVITSLAFSVVIYTRLAYCATDGTVVPQREADGAAGQIRAQRLRAVLQCGDLRDSLGVPCNGAVVRYGEVIEQHLVKPACVKLQRDGSQITARVERVGRSQ